MHWPLNRNNRHLFIDSIHLQKLQIFSKMFITIGLEIFEESKIWFKINDQHLIK